MRRDISLGGLQCAAAEGGLLCPPEISAATAASCSELSSASTSTSAAASQKDTARRRQQQQRAVVSVLIAGLIGLAMTAAMIAAAIGLKRCGLLPRYMSLRLHEAAYSEWLVDSVPSWLADSASALRLHVQDGVARPR